VRRDNRVNNKQGKKIARIKYAERQIEKFIKWSIDNRGRLLYSELVELHETYNIKCYG